jgi:alpha-glucoside transport system permease protein
MSTTPTPAPSAVKTRPGTEQTTRAEGKRRKRSWLPAVTLTIVVILWMIPSIGLLVTSFRSQTDAVGSGWWTALFNPFDTEWTIGNYGEVLESGGLGNAFINSFVVTIPATIIPLLVAAMGAYAFAFMRFRGRDILFALIVGLLAVPVHVAFIPILQIFGEVGLVGQFAALWLVHTGFGMPLAIFILRSYMATLPSAVIESAKIDGASHFQTFWRLILPMSVPALAAFAIFQFLWVWNDLLIALVFLGGGRNEVVTINLVGLIGQYGQRWNLLSAGAFLTMVVPLIVFFSLQRYFIRGMAAGSVKG